MDKSPAVEAIRGRYKDINDRQSKLTKTEKSISGMSAEGAALIAWLEGKDVRKFEFSVYGESGQSVTEVYFSGGKLDFVYERTLRYRERLNAKGAQVEEDRYYFEGGKLIWWVRGKDRAPAERASYAAKEAEVLADVKDLQNAYATPGEKLYRKDGRYVAE